MTTTKDFFCGRTAFRSDAGITAVHRPAFAFKSTLQSRPCKRMSVVIFEASPAVLVYTVLSYSRRLRACMCVHTLVHLCAANGCMSQAGSTELLSSGCTCILCVVCACYVYDMCTIHGDDLEAASLSALSRTPSAMLLSDKANDNCCCGKTG